MNERIKNLADEAARYSAMMFLPTGENGDKLFVEKFAELIVQECSEEIRKQGTDWIDWQPSQLGIRPEYVAMAEHLKQHFGFEE